MKKLTIAKAYLEKDCDREKAAEEREEREKDCKRIFEPDNQFRMAIINGRSNRSDGSKDDMKAHPTPSPFLGSTLIRLSLFVAASCFLASLAPWQSFSGASSQENPRSTSSNIRVERTSKNVYSWRDSDINGMMDNVRVRKRGAQIAEKDSSLRSLAVLGGEEWSDKLHTLSNLRSTVNDVAPSLEELGREEQQLDEKNSDEEPLHAQDKEIKPKSFEEDRPWPLLSRRVHKNVDITNSNSDWRYKSIFYGAYRYLYKTKNSYSRVLIDTNDTHDTVNTNEASDEEDLSHELSIEVTYEDTYDVLVFLGVVYILGEVAFRLGIPSLVGQIIAGFLLGPPLANYVPFPEAMVLVGDLGLILLLVEAGIELDVGLVKEAGVRPVLIALTGSVVPFSIGLGLAMAQGKSVKSAITSGACFSPTSLGVAANALSGGKALNTPVGQLIVASAVIDDMIGLIILSMLDVLVAEDPDLYEYFIPIISAVGFLIVLGLSAITWIPSTVNNKILPRFKPEHRPYAALVLLSLLVMAYLPMMFYSRASHLTGAFLAGLAFSQVEGVHHAFVSEAGSIMGWLLRIFFSASIGFQVPIKNFGNKNVIAWGFAFYVAVLGKLPVGFFAPKYQEKVPKNYPFNPYTRDVVVTSVAMTCRGEFSFIIAAFGLGEGLLDSELYSAIIFGVLLSSITSPILLTLILRYYNHLASKYLEQDQLDKSNAGGKAPLYVNIQIRSAVVRGMQGSIKRCVNSLGLFVIDQRSWHPRGLDVVVATELYAVDSKTMVDIVMALRKLENHNIPSASPGGEELGHANNSLNNKSSIIPEDEQAPSIHDYVAERCEEIRQALLHCPDLVDANVKVLQWVPLADAMNQNSKLSTSEKNLAVETSIIGEVTATLKNKETIDTLVDEHPSVKKTRLKALSGPLSFGKTKEQIEHDMEAGELVDNPFQPEPVTSTVSSIGQPSEGLRRRPRRVKTVSSPAVSGFDLWREDTRVQDAAIAGAPTTPVQYDLQSGVRYGVARRQRMPSDLSAIVENAPSIEERLDGIVRHRLDDNSSAQGHFQW
mmetsp:Transcript_21173/g.28166  ORF Transcript_21173/g.28166 Transcript_21173/m.28166 type:complete len:1051 (-) Transcript_21173:3288-6440(-)